jgi:hypothetical protein
MAVPKKVAERISSGLKKYQAVLAEAKNHDISESDTVAIIADMLADVMGYKKYVEITAEFAVRNTYVDLAVKVENEIRFLVEAKAIGVELKDSHVKQSVDYGANQGIEWVVLSNGITWRIYKIQFAQPIDKILVFELDVLTASPRDPQVIECLGNLSREGFTRPSMTAFLQERQATSKFSIAAILMDDLVGSAVRRELRRAFPSVRIDEETIQNVIRNDVLKRDVVDSDEAHAMQEMVKKALKSAARAKAREKEAADKLESAAPTVAATPPVPVPVSVAEKQP